MDPMAAFMQWLAQADPQTQASVAAHMDSQGVPPPTPPQMDLGGMMRSGLQPDAIDTTYGGKVGGAAGTVGNPLLGELIPGQDTSAVPGVQSPGTTQAPPEDNGVGPFTTTVNPAPQAGASPSGLGQGIAAAGQKLAQPTATPEIPKGVSGGVHPPQSPAVNPAIVSMIAQLMNHPHATQAGPSLGSLIR